MDTAMRHDKVTPRQGFQYLTDHRRWEARGLGELGRGRQIVATMGHLRQNNHAVIYHAAEF